MNRKSPYTSNRRRGLTVFPRLATALGLALVFAGTPAVAEKREKEPPPPDIGGGWVLAGILKDGDEKPPYLGDRVTVRFEGRSFTGSPGVNSMSGTFTATADGGFDVSGLIMTEMASLDRKLMAQESEVSALLMGARRWEIAGGELWLTDDAGKNGLRFRPNAPPPAARVKGILWELAIIEIADGDAVSGEPPAPGAIPTIRIGDDAATGSGGTKEYSAPCEIGEDGELKLGGVLVKGGGGAPPAGRAAALEAKFLGLLPKMTRYSARGDRLTLSDGAGDAALHFKAAGQGAIPAPQE